MRRLTRRASSVFDRLIASGVSTLQWGFGPAIDALHTRGVSMAPAFQWAFVADGTACVLSCRWPIGSGRHDPVRAARSAAR